MSHELERLKTLLPLVDKTRRQWLLGRIREMESERRGGEIPRSWLEGPVAASGLAGTGGLSFQAGSPGGAGRLVSVPFFLQAGDPYVITDAGLGNAPISHPEVLLSIGTNNEERSIGPLEFKTRNVAWARLRVVGFQVAKKYGLSQTDAIYTAPWVLAKDLRVDGGVSLMASDAYTDTTPFSNLIPQYGGLRDYPILEKDNRASVRISIMVGQIIPAVLLVSDEIKASLAMWLLCEVLEDDIVGDFLPGPYARGDALRRRYDYRTTGGVTR